MTWSFEILNIPFTLTVGGVVPFVDQRQFGGTPWFRYPNPGLSNNLKSFLYLTRWRLFSLKTISNGSFVLIAIVWEAVSLNRMHLFLSLFSLGMEGTNVPPIFKKALKKLFHIDSEWFRSRDWESSEQKCWGYFCHFRILFFSKSRVFFLLFPRENFNFFMIK